MLYLIIAIVTGGLFSLAYKMTGKMQLRIPIINFLLYFLPSIILLFWIWSTKSFIHNPGVVLTGIAGGVFSFFATKYFFLAVYRSNLSTSWTVVSLSVVIPLLASIFYWREYPNYKQIAGIVLVFVSLFFIYKDKKKESEK